MVFSGGNSPRVQKKSSTPPNFGLDASLLIGRQVKLVSPAIAGRGKLESTARVAASETPLGPPDCTKIKRARCHTWVARVRGSCNDAGALTHHIVFVGPPNYWVLQSKQTPCGLFFVGIWYDSSILYLGFRWGRHCTKTNIFAILAMIPPLPPISGPNPHQFQTHMASWPLS